MPLFPALGRPVLWTQGVHKTTKTNSELGGRSLGKEPVSFTDVAMSSPASTPPLMQALERLTPGHSMVRMPGEARRPRSMSLGLGPPQLLFLVVYRIKDSCRERSESFPR